jgi:hypothetical protein
MFRAQSTLALTRVRSALTKRAAFDKAVAP